MRRILQICCVILTYLFLYTPIFVLIIYSFNTKGFPSPWDGFTLKWYSELFHSKNLWEAFNVSLIVASSAMGISLILGTLLIFFRDSGGKVGKYLPLYYGNLIIPETVLAISILSFFLLFKIPLGIPTLIISHSVLGVGFVIPILYTRYLQLDPRLKEASLSLGATHFQTFFRVTLPFLRPVLFSVGLLVFILSFDDFILSYFTAGTRVETLSLHLLSMIRLGIAPTVNALSAVLLIISSLFVFLFFSPKIRSRIF